MKAWTYTQYVIITYNGKESEKEYRYYIFIHTYTHTYVTELLCLHLKLTQHCEVIIIQFKKRGKEDENLKILKVSSNRSTHKTKFHIDQRMKI